MSTPIIIRSSDGQDVEIKRSIGLLCPVVNAIVDDLDDSPDAGENTVNVPYSAESIRKVFRFIKHHRNDQVYDNRDIYHCTDTKWDKQFFDQIGIEDVSFFCVIMNCADYLGQTEMIHVGLRWMTNYLKQHTKRITEYVPKTDWSKKEESVV